jgi:hypothetical protein
MIYSIIGGENMCNCCGMSDDEKKEWEEFLAKKGEDESEVVEVKAKAKNKGLRGLFKC